MNTRVNPSIRCDIDFYADSSLADPISVYHQMLQLGPVVWMEHQSMYAICGHAEVTSALRNFKVFSSAHGVSIDDSVNPLIVGSTLNSDPPEHNNSRAITFKPLSTKALEAVRTLIETEAHAIAEQVVAQETFDAATELAPYLPLTIVRELVGLGDYGKDRMLDWGAATFELMGDPKERRATAVNNLKNLRTFLEDENTLENLAKNGWAKLATQHGIEQGMNPSRAAELMRDYIAPSLDTTISTIAFALSQFAQHPDQWHKLRQDRTLIKNAIEELVRLNTPIKSFSRYVTEDTEVAGIPIEKGSRVMVVFGAANRDPKRFTNPDKFDIERKVAGHVGFGQGVHACLGMHLARLEMTSLFNALADRVERFELAGPLVPAINSSIYSLASVPVKVQTVGSAI